MRQSFGPKMRVSVALLLLSEALIMIPSLKGLKLRLRFSDTMAGKLWICESAITFSNRPRTRRRGLISEFDDVLQHSIVNIFWKSCSDVRWDYILFRITDAHIAVWECVVCQNLWYHWQIFDNRTVLRLYCAVSCKTSKPLMFDCVTA